MRGSEIIDYTQLHGKTWGEVVSVAFKRYGCVLCGLLDIFPSTELGKDMVRHVIINPGSNYTFSKTVQNLFIISNHRNHAVNVVRNLLYHLTKPGTSESNVSLDLITPAAPSPTSKPHEDSNHIASFFLRY